MNGGNFDNISDDNGGEKKKAIKFENDGKKSLHKIYHETQTRQLCALHTLNNLFQDPTAFTKKDLDEIANLLSPNTFLFNPHKSALGNYDINVILMALQQKNFEAIWFNKRKDLKLLNLDVIFGFILNIPNSCDLWKNFLTMFTLSKRHWIAIRQINSIYFNLDSKLKEPTVIGNQKNLLEFFTENLEKNAEVFVIVNRETALENSWYKEEIDESKQIFTADNKKEKSQITGTEINQI
ncbi:sorting nexin-29 [Sarcoptes scabiei]|nr:sorting nexin-29 [Sarcoptes scabiei]